MKKILLLSIILLVSATWVVAQSSTGQPPSPNYPNGPSSHQMGGQNSQGSQDSPGMGRQSSPNDNTSGNHTQIEGCLAGSSGAYTLTDASGNTWQLQGDDAQLSKHVGESVRIAGSANSSGGNAGMAGQNFSVSRVRKISNTCNNAGSPPSE